MIYTYKDFYDDSEMCNCEKPNRCGHGSFKKKLLPKIGNKDNYKQMFSNYQCDDSKFYCICKNLITNYYMIHHKETNDKYVIGSLCYNKFSGSKILTSSNSDLCNSIINDFELDDKRDYIIHTSIKYVKKHFGKDLFRCDKNFNNYKEVVVRHCELIKNDKKINKTQFNKEMKYKIFMNKYGDRLFKYKHLNGKLSDIIKYESSLLTYYYNNSKYGLKITDKKIIDELICIIPINILSKCIHKSFHKSASFIDMKRLKYKPTNILFDKYISLTKKI